MTFVFPVLLGGLLLAGIPILLHLIQRQKPKVLLFPAFRFLLQKQRTNQRKLRLRHLLLLLLRILLIVALCLALARPKLFDLGFGLQDNRPVAAVFVFDTSPSMEYDTSGKDDTRLKEAKKRGKELLNELPKGSKIAILDTADLGASGRGDWLPTLELARQRIQELKINPGSASVTHRLSGAYRLLADLARDKSDPTGAKSPRLLVVFSDRTRASWDLGQMDNLGDASDQVPPLLEGLQQARGNIPNLKTLLKELREKLPPADGKDYPEQPLLDDLDKLQDWIPGLGPDDLPPAPELGNLVTKVRVGTRKVLERLPPPDDKMSKEAKEFRETLIKALQGNLSELGGVLPLFIDVGIEKPIDLAITGLELPPSLSGTPRQVFAADEKIPIKAHVQVTGQDYPKMTLSGQVYRGNKKLHELPAQPAPLKAGETAIVNFEIDAKALKLQPGPYQVKVILNQKPDLLPFNDVRYLTFAIREPRKVLVLYDEEFRGESLKPVFEVIDKAFGYKAEFHKPGVNLDGYKAVFLLSLANPDAKLWDQLADYVKMGNGVCIIPPEGIEALKFYNDKAAQKVMPGQLEKIEIVGNSTQGGGLRWNFDEKNIYQHSLFSLFKIWSEDKERHKFTFDRQTFRFWEVKPNKEGQSLVKYKEQETAKKKGTKEIPALLERTDGKVLLFTTLLNYSDRSPDWNNFEQNWFRLIMLTEAAKYLAGNPENMNLNFLSGQEAVVDIPAAPRFPSYNLLSEAVSESITLGDRETRLKFKRTDAGNYWVVGVPDKENTPLAGFSVNQPAEESNLNRVPPAEIEALFGPSAVIPIDRKANLRDVLKGHWRQPVELFPFLMLLLLLVLAVENLLSNKFYKQEPGEEEKKP